MTVVMAPCFSVIMPVPVPPQNSEADAHQVCPVARANPGRVPVRGRGRVGPGKPRGERQAGGLATEPAAASRGQSGDAARDEFALGVHPRSDQQRHDSISLIDGDSLRTLGMLSGGLESGFAISPDHQHLYMPDTYWSRGTRGTRIGVVTIYDAKTL